MTPESGYSVVDLGTSEQWVRPEAALPSWLDRAWLEKHNARFVCALTRPEDLAAIWHLTGLTQRLIAYPDLPVNRLFASDDGSNRLVQSLCRKDGAESYLRISPGATAPSKLEPLASSPAEVAETPLLALVSPMPPTRSGIANYCEELLPALSRDYLVTVVVEDVSAVASRLRGRFEIINHAEFLRAGDKFDRVMYHFGNSSFHYDYYQMLRAHPGFVVLHDVFLGDGIYSNYRVMKETELRQEIYVSHGWPALPDCETSPVQSIGLYPASYGVFSYALGVVVHSGHAASLLEAYLDATSLNALDRTRLAREVKPLPTRKAARESLGLDEAATVVASFGQINRNKCLDELMAAWTQSGLAERQDTYLCLVGHCAEESLSRALARWQRDLPHPERCILAGHTDDTTYENFLAASDIAVQLRRDSRGESSAALLDCMSAGICVIANAHGSTAELPGHLFLKLRDEFGIRDLAAALAQAAGARDETSRRGALAKNYVREHHSPASVAEHYREQMETSYRHGMRSALEDLRRELIKSIALMPAKASDSVSLLQQFEEVAACFTTDNRVLCGRQLMIDVSGLIDASDSHRSDVHVSEMLRAMLTTLDPDLRAEAIYFDAEIGEFRYARHYSTWLLGLSPLELYDDIVLASRGDLYLALDAQCASTDPKALATLQCWRGREILLLALDRGDAGRSRLRHVDRLIPLPRGAETEVDTRDLLHRINRSTVTTT